MIQITQNENAYEGSAKDRARALWCIHSFMLVCKFIWLDDLLLLPRGGYDTMTYSKENKIVVKETLFDTAITFIFS